MKLQKIALGVLVAMTLASCSVQQFAVNTKTEPFENGGKIFGEKTKDLNFKKSGDIHLFGVNLKESNVDELVKEMEVDKYTIETKSNLLLRLISMGVFDYRTVKVIEREK
jgi:hypothetical protein